MTPSTKCPSWIFWHTCPLGMYVKKAVRIVLSQCTPALFPVLLNVHRAELLAEEKPDKENLEFLEKSGEFYREINGKERVYFHKNAGSIGERFY